MGWRSRTFKWALWSLHRSFLTEPVVMETKELLDICIFAPGKDVGLSRLNEANWSQTAPLDE